MERKREDARKTENTEPLNSQSAQRVTESFVEELQDLDLARANERAEEEIRTVKSRVGVHHQLEEMRIQEYGNPIHEKDDESWDTHKSSKMTSGGYTRYLTGMGTKNSKFKLQTKYESSSKLNEDVKFDMSKVYDYQVRQSPLLEPSAQRDHNPEQSSITAESPKHTKIDSIHLPLESEQSVLEGWPSKIECSTVKRVNAPPSDHFKS